MALATPKPQSLCVWMPMRAVQFAFRERRDARDFLRQTTAVGIAQHDAIRARFFRRLPGGQRVFGLVFVAVESMFGVVDDDFAVVFEKLDRVADHREIFIRRGAEHFRDVQQPGFADDRDHRRFGFEQLAHQLVFFHGDALAAGHAEGGDFGVLPFAPARPA